MSDGIFERIETLLERIAVAVEGAGAAVSATPAKAATTAAKAGKVTQDALTELVQPLVQNDADKAKVKAVLVKFGLKRLGDAKPEQYEALHTEFSAIAGGTAPDDDDGDLIG